MKTLLMLAAATAAIPAPKPALAPSEIVAAAPLSDWVAIAPADLLVMDLASGRRVVIQLMPPPFSQGWVGNIRKLAAARWWDGTSINRVQDNYVVQWGDANGEDKAKAKKLPGGLVVTPQADYLSAIPPAWLELQKQLDGEAASALEKDGTHLNDKEAVKSPFKPRVFQVSDVTTPDIFQLEYSFVAGMPIAITTLGSQGSWPVHCYGMVGVGRDMPPNTGTGAELYTVIGHAPRHLDRNIALVGRVIMGIEHLSSLRRGTGALGFYEKAEERTGITSVRIGTEVAGLARFEYLSTESAAFAAYADARANRRDPFFILPAGGGGYLQHSRARAGGETLTPSLRAKRSNPDCTVRLDCFAPLAMTVTLAPSGRP